MSPTTGARTDMAVTVRAPRHHPPQPFCSVGQRDGASAAAATRAKCKKRVPMAKASTDNGPHRQNGGIGKTDPARSVDKHAGAIEKKLPQKFDSAAPAD